MVHISGQAEDAAWAPWRFHCRWSSFVRKWGKPWCLLREHEKGSLVKGPRYSLGHAATSVSRGWHASGPWLRNSAIVFTSRQQAPWSTVG